MTWMAAVFQVYFTVVQFYLLRKKLSMYCEDGSFLKLVYRLNTVSTKTPKGSIVGIRKKKIKIIHFVR